ncbi:hypothetical protein BKA70DRAFT_1473465 [Coprinopsis sp. MPI-PUGE-AT-0042]|nr:hypothetical protein BKA70DRAFT_1473465 [Coprinopsis sp. MPI-PUGE-AT-0042]
MAMMATQTIESDPFLSSTSSSIRRPPFPTAAAEETNSNGFAHRKSSSASSSGFPFSSTPSSPSKSSAGLPLQTPPPVKPNAHPYAIKTTATGVLSRSSSTTASPHYKESHRYVPPPSPSRRRSSFTDNGESSPTKGSHHYQGSSGGDGATSTRRGDAYRGHRYSQSLTDVSGSPAPAHGPPPRPLPVPPEFSGNEHRSMSASPTKSSGFVALQGEFEDSTPKQHTKTRRGKRPETLPADFMTPQHLSRSLLSWTPDQVAAYVRQTANSEELANVILQKQIAGRAFLRIASLGSDERDDVDQALRAASRTLRQSSLRGRIWGLNGTSNEHYRPRSDSESSNSSVESFSSNSARGNGRIRGMIESLERTSSMSSEEDATRSRSVSPTKPKFTFPPKPKVQDLFSPPQEPTFTPEDEVHATVKAHGHQVKEMPRLLPLPPTFTGGSNGILSPMTTGSTIAPNYTGGSEFGYMRPSPIISPAMSPAIQRSERASSRMLPLPPTGPVPVMQQPSPPSSAGILHHPIPRRNAGSQGVGVVNKLDQKAEEEELTMEELLSQGAEGPAPVSGVHAWEMDLGDTVKKVPGGTPLQPRIAQPPVDVQVSEAPRTPARHSPEREALNLQDGASPRPPAADLSFVNSRPARRVRGVRPKPRRSLDGEEKKNGSASGSASEGEVASSTLAAPSQSNASWRSARRTKRDSKGQGSSVLTLFDPPPTESAAVEKEKGSVDREARLDEREKAVEERERARGGQGRRDLRREQAAVKKLEQALEQREISLQAREADVGAREKDLEARDGLLEARQRTVEELEARLKARAKELDQRDQGVVVAQPHNADAGPSTRQNGNHHHRTEEEDTFTLASRLFRRIVAPVFGERLTGYILRPYEAHPEAPADVPSSDQARTDETGVQEEQRTRNARRGSMWLTMGNRDAGYLMLLGIGVCAIVLRVFLKKRSLA